MKKKKIYGNLKLINLIFKRNETWDNEEIDEDYAN